jgi:RNA polymerase sigma-70 factor (ECF subfamily)
VSAEDEIRSLRDSGDAAAAATRAIQAYGGEVLGFLIGLLRSEPDAEEVFAQASHDLWAGMPAFEARSSMRTWFYTLARNAASRHQRAPHQRAARRVPISEVSDIVARVRTETSPHLRSDVKDRFASIRDALDADDRWLLVLRVDRDMAWTDIARVMAAEGDSASDSELSRAAARLRKRFQLVKDLIRDRARAAGLLPDE